jgi:hypothetical protein
MLFRLSTGAPTAYQFEVRMELPDGQNSQLMLQSPVVSP